MKVKKRCCSKTKEGKVCKKSKIMDSEFCNIHKPKENCIICLEDFKKLKTLNCSHKFCPQCISKWIYLCFNDTCPLCRNEVTMTEVNYAFNYCLNNQMITKIQYIEYHIINDDLINYIDNILVKDSDYSYEEWQTFLNHLILNEEMYDKFCLSYKLYLFSFNI